MDFLLKSTHDLVTDLLRTRANLVEILQKQTYNKPQRGFANYLLVPDLNENN